MRKPIAFIFLIAFAGMLSGCCMSHDWADASCTQPKHCVKCGKTEGLSLLHDYDKATCTKPQTCTMCGATTGEPLGHTWVERTIGVPKTCSVCGETDGDPIYMEEVKFDKLPLIRAKDEEIALPFYLSEPLLFQPDRIIGIETERNIIHFYDYDQKETKVLNLDQYITDEYEWCYDTIPPSTGYVTYGLITYLTTVDPEMNCSIYMFDDHGDSFCEFHTKLDTVIDTYLGLYDVADDRYAKFGVDEEDPLLCVDLVTKSLVDPNIGSPIGVFHTSKKFKKVSTLVNNPDLLLARRSDGKTLYVDKRYQYSVGEFEDGSAFNDSGYALASPDGTNYDLIDREMNVLAKNVVQGRSVAWRGTNTFSIRVNNKKGKEEVHYYVIK